MDNKIEWNKCYHLKSIFISVDDVLVIIIEHSTSLHFELTMNEWRF